jgi:ABC-type nitrate/sulfonate/bicarbonate transport system permease component
LTAVASAAVAPGRWSIQKVAQNFWGLAGALLIWELACRAGLLPTDYVPTPSAVAVEIYREIFTPRWWLSTARTLSNWLAAIAIGAAIAIPVGIVLGSSEHLYRAGRVPLEFLRAVPPVALIPIVVLIAGATPRAAIFLAAYGCVWPMLIQTIYGVRAVDPLLRQVAVAYGIPRSGVLRHVTIPATTPYILTGLSVSSALSLIAIIGSEIIVGIAGVGSEINLARFSGANVTAYAFTIWTGILGLSIAWLVNRLKARLLRWQPAKQASA